MKKCDFNWICLLYLDKAHIHPDFRLTNLALAKVWLIEGTSLSRFKLELA